MRDVWRFATTKPGALCVMTSGALLMLKSLVDSWDTPDSVCPGFGFNSIAVILHPYLCV